MTPTDHWLPPDNYQEDPTPVVAHRTSPTNIGLALLSTVTAYELGYLGSDELAQRLENTLTTVEKLEKYRGHLLNWYDTRTLEPLRPQYVSTVDSGNLAGHLLSIRQSCLALAKTPIPDRDVRPGLRDTLEALLTEVLSVPLANSGQGAVTVRDLHRGVLSLRDVVKNPDWVVSVASLHSLLTSLTHIVDISSVIRPEISTQQYTRIGGWLEQTRRQILGCYPGSDGQSPTSAADTTLTKARSLRFQALADRCDNLFTHMDFTFLLEPRRQVFSIGFSVADNRTDNAFYDILASEARLTSFVAISKGDANADHWYRLSRQMTPVGGGRALVSWTATMFEYLMPLLVMRRYEGTLLDETYVSVVKRQIEYGRQHGVPWGISEAGYNARDLQLNYQYGPFGVPGLGLKRGLSADLVISPYSTLLAALIDPQAALSNLIHLTELGVLGRFGFYESLDYTQDRLPHGQSYVIVKSFMAHHQGMSLIALGSLVCRNTPQERFHAEPRVMATQILLQERVPLAIVLARPRPEEVHPIGPFWQSRSPKVRSFDGVDLPFPATQLLGNGSYSVMITSTGAGYSRCGKLAISRWREDGTRDAWGQYFYIRSRQSGRIWSAGHQPLCTPAHQYDATFTEDKVEIHRHDPDTITHTEIVVSPEDDVELRCISLTNQSHSDSEFEVTSYLEVVLATPADDDAHPAFSNLFVETEFEASESALLATRRRRSASEQPVWAFHVGVVEGETIAATQYETDRSRLLGRGRDTSHPLVITENRPLSNTVGSVLDPIFSLRHTVRIPPGKTVRLTFVTGLALTREDALRLTDKYHDVHIFDRETELAWTKSRVQLRHLNIDMYTAHTFQQLAGRIIYSNASLRPSSRDLARNTRTQEALWAYGISGDLPVVLIRISDEKDVGMVREILRAHEFLGLKGLIFDLVILNEHASNYTQHLQEELVKQIRASGSFTLMDKPGGVFIRRADIMPPEDVVLLRTLARVQLIASRGTLAEQLSWRTGGTSWITSPLRTPNIPPRWPNTPLPNHDLAFSNGLGGFREGGQEYQILLQEGQWTPAPWLNVIANRGDFGTQISETGSGYTWSINSRENRLSNWSNDAVSDPASEVIYIRDDLTGELWTPTALPIREKEPYLICHGQGYSSFTHHSHGVEQVLHVFVAVKDSVKINILRLKNVTQEVRHLSVISYVEWVLGSRRDVSAPHVITEVDPLTGVILARNPYNSEFASRVAFAHMPGSINKFTCDRRQFIGRNGSQTRPHALTRNHLAGTSGAGLDPCAALQIHLTLAPGEVRDVVILLGEAVDVVQALTLATHYHDSVVAWAELGLVKQYWKDILGKVQVHTPEPAMDLMLNHWLLYQTIVCRLWARSAFYQSGGAYGFRDQLQDVMALVHVLPEVSRQQILRAAGRQFPEGDVQHWWHLPSGRGVRTHFSDDLLWLPFVTSYYLKTTGDNSVLEEVTPFLLAPLLLPSQETAYTVPGVSTEACTLYEHCVRTLDHSLAIGRHGLPLMGCGDWNDGMNRVGSLGQGESVWMGWFLYATLEAFLPWVQKKGDLGRTATYRQHMAHLQSALEQHGWDGGWYRRAFFDDGQPLGSATNDECRIDSITQSWAVLSGAADPTRAVQAMAAMEDRLVDQGEGLVRLFTPPFDKGKLDPGYIKGYAPGIRENGGQYTHAAIWVLMAFSKLGDGDRSGELFSLLNPINHATTRAGVHKYKVEPYVVAADIYGVAPHVGRGGWTWYTGSASWMYRAGIESILGCHRRGDILHLDPCIPRDWREFELTYRYLTSTYRVMVKNPDGICRSSSPHTEVDGQVVNPGMVQLVDDGLIHSVLLILQ